MEFRDFCLIFVRHAKLFFGVFSGFVLLSIVVFLFQPAKFEASLTLNVSRSGSQSTPDYTYDQFYRLQADERFADTVVRWLAAPSVRSDIRSSAGVSASVVDSIVAKRLSSQMIAVTYSSQDRIGFGEMSRAVSGTLNAETAKLNALSKDTDWFVVLSDEPVVSDARIPARIMIPSGAALGAFFGFWIVLLVWYFQEKSGKGN